MKKTTIQIFCDLCGKLATGGGEMTLEKFHKVELCERCFNFCFAPLNPLDWSRYIKINNV